MNNERFFLGSIVEISVIEGTSDVLKNIFSEFKYKFKVETIVKKKKEKANYKFENVEVSDLKKIFQTLKTTKDSIFIELNSTKLILSKIFNYPEGKKN
jgi:hypothetical protein